MKLNHWTMALAAAGVVSMGAVAQAEEATESVKTLISDTTISGYVSTSAIWRPGTASAGYPVGGFTGAGKHDGFNLDVVDLKISKGLDESEWAAGYNAELWFGPDATTLGTLAGTANLAIKNAYVALRAPVGNGIDFKMGVFDTIIGHEASNASENPNYTRSLAWGIQPTTHTGLLAAYRFSDLIAVTAGVANGRAAVINGKTQGGVPPAATLGSESAKAYMGGVELTAPDDWGFLSGSKLHAQVIDSPTSTAPGAAANKNTVDIHVGATLNTPVDAWKVGISYYYLANNPALAPSAATAAGASSYASVWGLYNSYQATEKLGLAVRAEYAKATDGTWYAAAVTDNDHANELISITATVDYALWENVISRLEARWDRAIDGGRPGSVGPFGGSGALGNPTDDESALLVALNVIYKF